MKSTTARYGLSLLAASSFLTLVFAAPVTAAQEAQAGEGGVTEIVVTARKQEELAKDVPVSITSLSGDQLAAVTAGGADLTFLSARVPSVNVESSFGRTFPRFYIRGLGNTDFDLNASQPVSLVYDEVVYENPVLKGFPVFDVASIEVLRGPQGTLFGRNTPAGIVKFDSVKPSEEFSAYAKGAVRNFNGFDLEGALGGDLGGGFSARASLLFQRQDDWVKNFAPGRNGELAYGGYQEMAGRLQLRFQPNDRLDALLNLHAREFDGESQLFRANVVTRGSNSLNRNFVRNAVFFDGGAGNPQELSTRGATATIKYDLGDVVVTSVTGYESIVDFLGRGDIDGGFGAAFLPAFIPMGPGVIPFPAETADGIEDHSQFTQEVRLSGETDRVSWQAGVYLFNEDVTITSFNFDTLAGGTQNGEARQTQETEAWAAFGSATFRPTDRLALTAGLRYSDDNKDFVGRRITSPFGAGPLGPITRSVGDSALSWDVSAVYELTGDTNLYGRIARGFRAPSIQGRILFGNAVTTADSEFVTSYEAGTKARLFDRRLRADLSAFYYTIEDQQLTAIGGAGNFNQLLNADEGVGYGFEADLEFVPNDNLTFTAGLAYNNTEINDPTLTVAPCGAPCTVLDPVVGGAARIDGNPFPNAPEWTGSITAEYRYPLSNGGTLFAFTDWAYKGDVNFFLYESVEFQEDGFWEGGLRAGYQFANGNTTLAVFGRNITDTEARTGGIDFNNLTGFVNGPRIWGLELAWKN